MKKNIPSQEAVTFGGMDLETAADLYAYGLLSEEMFSSFQTGALTEFGDGADRHFFGGTADVVVDGGDGLNRITTGVGNDLYLGGKDRDIFSGQNGDDLAFGGDGDDFLQGYLGDDVIVGGAGDDVLHGWNGDDVVLGGSGADTVAGTQDKDFAFGGVGNDVIRVESWAGEPEIARFPEMEQVNPDEPLDQKQLLVGGAGYDRFEFRWLIDAKPEIIQKWTRPDGTVDWEGVAGENTNVHDHWVETMGDNIVVADYNPEEDELFFSGHTVTLTRIDVVDADGDGLEDDSIASFHSTNPIGTHDQDDLGSITFINHLLTKDEVDVFDGIFAGVLHPEDTNLFSEITSSGTDAPIFVRKPHLIGKMQMEQEGVGEAMAPYYSVDQLSETQTKVYKFSAEDPNGLPLTYSISGEDAASLRIAPTGALYAPMGLASLGLSADGDDRFSVDVTVTNSSGASSVMHFEFRVDPIKPDDAGSTIDDGPIFLLDSYDIRSAVEETIAPSDESSLIRQFVALDANGNAVEYLLAGEDAANDSFVFNTATGVLEASVGLDQLGMSADGDGKFEFVVSAIDAHGNTTDLDYTFDVEELGMNTAEVDSFVFM